MLFKYMQGMKKQIKADIEKHIRRREVSKIFLGKFLFHRPNSKQFFDFEESQGSAAFPGYILVELES